MAMMIERRSSDAIKMQCKRGFRVGGAKGRRGRMEWRSEAGGREAEGKTQRIYALRFRIGTSGSPKASTSTSWRTAAGFSVTVDDDAVTGDLLAVAALSRYAGKRTSEDGAQQWRCKAEKRHHNETLSAHGTVTALDCKIPRCGELCARTWQLLGLLLRDLVLQRAQF